VEQDSSAVKPLPKKFKRGGYYFTQLKREGPFALYFQSSSEAAKEPSAENDKSAYEIIRVRVIPARAAFGKDIGAYERYPSDEEWGTFGWTAIGREAAEKKFEDVKQKFGGKSDDEVVDVAIESCIVGPETGKLIKSYFFDEASYIFDKTKFVAKR
jgi:hypothetical protein